MALHLLGVSDLAPEPGVFGAAEAIAEAGFVALLGAIDDGVVEPERLEDRVADALDRGRTLVVVARTADDSAGAARAVRAAGDCGFVCFERRPSTIAAGRQLETLAIGLDGLPGTAIAPAEGVISLDEARLLAADGQAPIQRVVRRFARRSPRWWVRIDLAVLAASAFAAADDLRIDGLTLAELEALAAAFGTDPAFCGAEVVGLRPERDLDGRSARAVVRTIARTMIG